MRTIIEYRVKRISVVVVSLILILMVYFLKDSTLVMRTATCITLFVFFYSVDVFFDVRFKARHYIFVLFIAVFSLLFSPLYYIYPSYDKLQHFIQPMLLCSIIFQMTSKLKIELKWKLIFAFFISTSLLGAFEIGEYLLDYFFDLKLQGVYLRDITGLEKYHLLQSPIDDTMVDLSYGFIGCLLHSWFVWIYLKLKTPTSKKK